MDRNELCEFVSSDDFQKAVRDAFRNAWAADEATAVALAIAEAFKQVANKAGY